VGTDQYGIAPGPLDKMHVDIQPTAFIAFNEKDIMDETPEVSSLIGQLIEEVERLIPNFENFFA
jgi:hypothetical protein